MSKYKYDITIAILNYNREKFLDRAVRSSVGQVLSGKNQEVIVIDDGSTDNSLEFLRKYNKTIKIVLEHTSIKKIWVLGIAQS